MPTDVFNGRATPERYQIWFRLLQEANGNMLRIWGGGQYEPKSFSLENLFLTLIIPSLGNQNWRNTLETYWAFRKL